MNNKITDEEKTAYRKGCLTGLVVMIAFIVLSSGISQVTSYRTNIKKSCDFLYKYKCEYPKNATEKEIIIHMANNNFITVKTNLSNSGEGVAEALKIKDNVIKVAKNDNQKLSGLKILGKEGKTLYNSTTSSKD